MHLSACIWSVNLTYRIDDICWILEVKAFQFGVCGQRWGSETLGLGRWFNPTRLRFNNVDISYPNISKTCYRVYTLFFVSQKLSTILKQLYCNTWRFGLCVHLEVANNYLLVKENNQILPFEIFVATLLPNHKWYLNIYCLLDLLSLYLQSVFL